MMCERHPPHSPALINEVEAKIEQDAYIIQEIRKRLREQQFEKYSSSINFQEIKTLTKAGVEMHTQLLEYRYKMRQHLQKVTEEDANLLQGKTKARFSLPKRSTSPLRQLNQALVRQESDKHLSRFQAGVSDWKTIWTHISARTGITDPDIFFQRFNNWYVYEGADGFVVVLWFMCSLTTVSIIPPRKQTARCSKTR